jgi:cell division protein FtsA
MPENLVGMTDKLNSPAFSTSVGLLRWAVMMSEYSPQRDRRTVNAPRGVVQMQGGAMNWEKIKNWLRRLLP